MAAHIRAIPEAIRWALRIELSDLIADGASLRRSRPCFTEAR
jgi:hypothetical protein